MTQLCLKNDKNVGKHWKYIERRIRIKFGVQILTDVFSQAFATQPLHIGVQFTDRQLHLLFLVFRLGMIVNRYPEACCGDDLAGSKLQSVPQSQRVSCMRLMATSGKRSRPDLPVGDQPPFSEVHSPAIRPALRMK